MSYVIRKPAWIGKVGPMTVISPAAVLEVADWWDAWGIMWFGIWAAATQNAAQWAGLGVESSSVEESLLELRQPPREKGVL